MEPIPGESKREMRQEATFEGVEPAGDPVEWTESSGGKWPQVMPPGKSSKYRLYRPDSLRCRCQDASWPVQVVPGLSRSRVAHVARSQSGKQVRRWMYARA